MSLAPSVAPTDPRMHASRSIANTVVLTASLSPGLNSAGAGWVALGNGQFSRSVGAVGAGATNSVTLQASVDPAVGNLLAV